MTELSPHPPASPARRAQPLAAQAGEPRLQGVRRVARASQSALATSPALSKAYITGVSALCRHALGPYVRQRVENLVARTGVAWPPLRFAPRSVVLGRKTRVRLTPHLGEFCQAALFSQTLGYENAVFAWLEREAAARYDAVIEIGANVGVYSVFFDALMKAAPGARLQRAICFEPALEPFARLLQNLQANQAARVLPFRAAIAESAGFRTFYEPEGHLTNGSLLQGFAQQFAEPIAQSVVATFAPQDLSFFFERHRKILLKIDVEGFEPQLVAAFAATIERHRPDILIEVLEGTVAALNAVESLRGYRKRIVTPEGLRQEDALRADARHRDWLLEWPDGPGDPLGPNAQITS